MLWVSVLLPHLAIELQQSAPRPEPAGVGAGNAGATNAAAAPVASPTAITDGSGARRRIIAANSTARASGIAAGMGVPAAMLREPALRLLDRSKADERHAMQAIACWAHQFTSDVCLDLTRWTLWLEVGSSLRYFNGLTKAYTAIRHGIERLGYTALLGIAPTLEAAVLLAKQPDALPIINPKELRAGLKSLPLVDLDLGAKELDQLHTAGLRSVGELLEIPTASLARRFGEDLPDYLQRMLGERPEVKKRHRAPLAYRRRFELTDGVETVAGLLFPLRRILQELEGYLRGRDTAIQKLMVTLRHRGPSETALQLMTSAPQRDAVRLFALLREKLERTQLTQPVTDIVLAADEFVEPQVTQADFFDDHQRQNDSWSALLDKLRARLGDAAVRRLGLKDDHRPEKAWCIEASNDDGMTKTVGDEFPDRPLWLLDPRPLDSLPQLLGTPERIEAGWWAGEDSSRDYYLARSDEGARWWLYREAATNRWYLQGLWA